MIGTVVSKKIEKSAVVEIERFTEHPLYKKRIKRRKKYLVHDELNAKEGDRVVFEPTSPVSKRKRFKVVEVLK